MRYGPEERRWLARGLALALVVAAGLLGFLVALSLLARLIDP